MAALARAEPQTYTAPDVPAHALADAAAIPVADRTARRPDGQPGLRADADAVPDPTLRPSPRPTPAPTPPRPTLRPSPRPTAAAPPFAPSPIPYVVTGGLSFSGVSLAEALEAEAVFVAAVAILCGVDEAAVTVTTRQRRGCF